MQLEKDYLYHIYNQGNNQRKIFFKQENYIFFLEKLKTHLLPYVDVIAWCLMPNHFHLMVLIKEEELEMDDTHTVTQSHGVSKLKINDSIGIMLRSYTRAINKQENFTGKLFKEKTKAECINCLKKNTPSFISNKMTSINLISEKQYPQVCFDYIHQNPVKAGMVKNEVDYEFSSAKDYANLRNNKLTNKTVAIEYIDYQNTHTVTQSHGVSKILKNPELELAQNFVEKTDRNIFLTGKAGTGKTTFLHKIKTESNKRLVVVAPTGVAAINAKGVTIHSFFQMPFGPIIPGVQAKKSKYKFGKTKIDIIRSLDLLIIDEISMVRADLLDGIDQVLKRYRDRNKVFGGVQVLMIGDLQQLSPVVKPYEWQLLSPYYDTSFFFSSHSFRKSNAISIELKHIYRQDNQEFIKILNEIRNDKLTQESATILNSRYQPEFVPKKEDGYITLTTHNNRANTINEKELDKLDTKNHFYKATVKGKFNEYAYPTQKKLELKVGAQVMFIKNDSSVDKRYYNGKIGTVTFLDKDYVYVQCGDDEVIEATPETWENVSYNINQETKIIDEKIAGSFEQMPFRLAWAITIHKSQGLTFEKAIIDAEASFAHGQTYVALSRCKSLEGMILKTKIKESSIINDKRVTNFTKEVEDNPPNESDLSNSKKAFQLNLINELFNFYGFIFPLKRIKDIYYNNKTSIKGTILENSNTLTEEITNLLKVGTLFKNQLNNLSESVTSLENDSQIQERLQKAITYFRDITNQKIKPIFEAITFTTDNKQVKKDIHFQLDKLEDLLSVKLYCLNGLINEFTVSKYLELRGKSVLQKENKPKTIKKRVAVTSTDHPILFESLRTYRNELAKENDIPPFQIFTQDTLFEFCTYFPITEKQLLKINGMGKIRVQKHGDDILRIIQKYISENDLQPKEIVFETKKKNL
jgi:REP element-mobilizing transposase RayT